MIHLQDLGFDRFFAEQLNEETVEKGTPARITSQHRGRYELISEKGPHYASISPHLRNTLVEEAFPAVGDWVLISWPTDISNTGEHDAVIIHVLDRRTVFVRSASGKQTKAQVVAANVDVTFVVCGLDEDYNVHRIERYLARVYASGAEPVVILNKTDLCDNTEERILEVERACIDVPVLPVSGLCHDGLSDIQMHVWNGRTAAFVGSSGAGKSTIINGLIGEEQLETRPVRKRDGRGTHTTTRRQLIPLPEGGLLIDTPGMRELELIDSEGLDEVFSDIEKFAKHCRFRDCRHVQEPGCAVIAAVESGDLPADRLDHFLKLSREAKANAIRHDAHLRKKSEKVLSKIIHQAKRIQRQKGHL